MARRALYFASFLAFILATASAAPSFAISKEFNQTYPLTPGGVFELQNVNGTVDVQTWDRDEVEVHAVKTAKHQESDLSLVSIDVEAKPESVSVTTRYPQNEGVEVAVEYVVHVPRCAHVEHLGTVNGSLRVAGVEAVEDLRTVNGNIEVFDGGGAVHAHTTNGNVHIELLHLAGQERRGGGDDERVSAACGAGEHAGGTRCALLERELFLGAADVSAEHAASTRNTRAVRQGRCADSFEYDQRRNSRRGSPVDGLIFHASNVVGRRTTMKKNVWMTVAGLAVLTPGLIALPGHSTTTPRQMRPRQARIKINPKRKSIASR